MPQPKLLHKPWADDGLRNDIPAARTTSLAQEAATYTDGFPSVTMTPIALGGKPPSGKDMNGILNEITSHIVYQNKGERYRFDQDFCSAIGGYPKGAVLMSDTGDTEYVSTVDRNTTNPNSGGANWRVLSGNGKVDKTTTIAAGNGLTGGGTLADNRTLTLGTPSSITASSTNSVTTTSHTHAIDQASTSTAGIVQLSTATDSTNTNMAATPSAVKAAYDLAASKAGLSDFASLRAGNGYQKLANGLILQWGSVVVGNDSVVNITFPVAFPSAALSAQSTVSKGGAIGGTSVLSSHVGSLSTTGMSIGVSENGVPGPNPVYWFAIGY